MDDEIIITREQLKELLKENILQDRPNGWFYKDIQVEIVAIHTKDSRDIYDITNAQSYKIKKKER